MHAHDLGVAAAASGDLGDRQGGGIGGEQRVGRADPVQLAEQFVLDLDILEHRLDDDVAVGQRFDVVAGMPVGQYDFPAACRRPCSASSARVS
ncbi:hypothetical protein G6F68_015258 [Rhizopus microsporus]|nr:hypothetical protein G6F31_019771 [Rhizopus arrhizus]KAG1244898.1 hypothetical protein G6F68_015258 [Rhizopus microsporus]